jgi:GH24 family phage-related lysozyme (muramidase)
MADTEALSLAAALIEREEGIETTAYLDAVGVPTICAGLTRYPNGTGVRIGDVCKPAICRAYLEQMLRDDYLPNLKKIPGWAKLGPQRKCVLMSFAWNMTYAGDFYEKKDFETISGVLRDGATDASAYTRMPAALALYNKAGGKVLPGLVQRRRREGEIWNKEGGGLPNGLLVFTANRGTFLKKAPIDAKYLSHLGAKPMAEGMAIQVAKVEEIPADSHAWVELAWGAGRWAIFQPHWASKAQPKPKPPGTQVDWSDFSASVGKHITVGEVLQYDARRQPRRGSVEELEIIKICFEFDKIRSAWGQPIGVTSGYRPEPINREVGGVSNSQHVLGKALDVYPMDGRLDDFFRWIAKRWSGGLGDGRRRGFVHLDTRNGGKFHPDADAKPAAIWDY